MSRAIRLRPALKPAGDRRRERGSALISALLMLTVMGLFLFGFQTINHNELLFAGYSRNSAIAFGIAEAGAQEGIERAKLFGLTPGTTCFVNSLTPSATCGGSTTNPNVDTVVAQAWTAANPSIFPILSLASYNGATRAVRILIRESLQNGFGRTIVGPSVNFQGNTGLVTGDTYAQTSVFFQGNYTATPQPPYGVLAGTTIALNGTMPGGAGLYTYTYECASGSLTEVAPTNCARSVGGSWPLQVTLPSNWHPMTPTGMPAADFNTVVQWAAANPGQATTAGVSVVQATQNGTGVTYSPASYTPPYWSLSGDNSKVLLVTASKPICVNTSGGTVAAATGTPPACAAGTYYGSNVSGTNYAMRFVDWGLVQDDLTRDPSATFFEPNTCSTCNNGGPDGNANGIQYVPILPAINVLAHACTSDVTPGSTVFDNAISDPLAPSCTGTISSTSVSFTGTQSAPEALVIDNGAPGSGHTVTINSNVGDPCSSLGNGGWESGVILATGDISLNGNTALIGFIYTPGTLSIQGNASISGGVYSAGGSGSSAQVSEGGNFAFCGGSGQMVQSPIFYQYAPISWEDRPNNKP
jgi:hypothetical protein